MVACIYWTVRVAQQVGVHPGQGRGYVMEEDECE